MVEQLNNLYLQASDSHIKHGMTWYWDAHHICKRIAKHTRLPLYKVVGVMAALSPRNKWARNISDCAEICKTPKRKRKHVKTCCYSAMKRKAIKVLDAESPEEVYKILNGTKIQSFYSNILKPWKSDTVTVDVWAMRSVGLDKAPNKTEYKQVSDAYKQVANKRGIKPHELQAIIWGVIRGTSVA
jgi:hypothetical protein